VLLALAGQISNSSRLLAFAGAKLNAALFAVMLSVIAVGADNVDA
jgi:hypothetical protein